MEIKIVNARVSFAHGLFKATAMEEGQQPKFGADFILQEESQVFKKVEDKWVAATVKDVMLAVANEAWKGKGAEILGDLEASKKCYRNGDKRRSKSGDVYEGYEGHWYITAKNATRPTVVDRNRAPVQESDGTVYSGCYVNVIMDIYAVTDPKRKGVFAGLRGVQFSKEGDAFAGGGVAKADAFDDLGDAPQDKGSDWA
jgi:hypothetical protein